ncbi:MAG TPA: deaminase [Streptosporangiaceae bacterium]|nr:deaminase [Streptosporangiaceae bacterium]
MQPEQMIALALEAAEEGMMLGEMPIGAVVLQGDEVVGRAYTQERTLRRHIVHADLMAMLEADASLGFRKSTQRLTLAVNLEPCLMCIGAAMTLGVDRVLFGLESPDDGGVELLDHWNPAAELPFFRRPEITGGYFRAEVKDQFARFAALESAPEGMRRWALGMAGLP